MRVCCPTIAGGCGMCHRLERIAADGEKAAASAVHNADLRKALNRLVDEVRAAAAGPGTPRQAA